MFPKGTENIISGTSNLGYVLCGYQVWTVYVESQYLNQYRAIPFNILLKRFLVNSIALNTHTDGDIEQLGEENAQHSAQMEQCQQFEFVHVCGKALNVQDVNQNCD